MAFTFTPLAARLDGLAAPTTADPFSRSRRTNARGGDASAVFPEVTTGAAARLDGLAAPTTVAAPASSAERARFASVNGAGAALNGLPQSSQNAA